jgi:hypothetical protein
MSIRVMKYPGPGSIPESTPFNPFHLTAPAYHAIAPILHHSTIIKEAANGSL